MPEPISIDYDLGRDVKRRRTVAPVLDGQSRGWNRKEPDDSEEDEEDMSQDDEQEIVTIEGRKDEWQAGAGEEYKSTNNLLRELHVLQQHKLMFSNRSSSSPSPSLYSSAQSNRPSPQSQGPNGMPTKSFVPPLSESPRTHPSDGYDSKGATNQYIPNVDVQAERNEVQRVKERYEDTNRLLGSLFLSRRRELLGPSGNSPNE